MRPVAYPLVASVPGFGTPLLLRSFRVADGAAWSLAFQEYSAEYPHRPFTVGIAGRPGGPDFYINLLDNVKNHGPGGIRTHNLRSLLAQ